MFFFFSSRRRHTRFDCDWSSDVCSSDLSLNVLDVGGGSTEIAVGSLDDGVSWFASFAIGSGFLADSYFRSDPPSPHELHAADRSEERRVGKECRSRWSPYH